jgi:hypothetical protein
MFPALRAQENPTSFLLGMRWDALPSAGDIIQVETFWHFVVAAGPRQFSAHSGPDHVVQIEAVIDRDACRAFDTSGLMSTTGWTAEEFREVWARVSREVQMAER